MLRVGISKKVAEETTRDNFDHIGGADPELNVFRMNTVGGGDPPGPREHFRSTGIRDGPNPASHIYSFFEDCARFDEQSGRCPTTGCAPDTFSITDITECATLVWDHDKFLTSSGLPAQLPSNDILPSKRPPKCPEGRRASGLNGCDSEDATKDVEPCCLSQLHGAITFMFQEFGTPTGERAFMTTGDMRALWLESIYPPDFAARSPRNCSDPNDPTAAGCQGCLDLVPSSLPGGLTVSADSSTEAQRYCRCLASKDLGTNALDEIAEHGRLGCLKEPLVNATVRVGLPPQQSRRLEAARIPSDESLQQELQTLLHNFYHSQLDPARGIRYSVRDVLIVPLGPHHYSVRLATTKENAEYLAYKVEFTLKSFADGNSSSLVLLDVSVSDDLRLNRDCGQFCEASGSFSAGIRPRQTAPPSQPASPLIQDPCAQRCLQATCGDFLATATCRQLQANDCTCNDCCTTDSPEPLPPPSPPSSPLPSPPPSPLPSPPPSPLPAPLQVAPSTCALTSSQIGQSCSCQYTWQAWNTEPTTARLVCR